MLVTLTWLTQKHAPALPCAAPFKAGIIIRPVKQDERERASGCLECLLLCHWLPLHHLHLPLFPIFLHLFLFCFIFLFSSVNCRSPFCSAAPRSHYSADSGEWPSVLFALCLPSDLWPPCVSLPVSGVCMGACLEKNSLKWPGPVLPYSILILYMSVTH